MQKASSEVTPHQQILFGHIHEECWNVARQVAGPILVSEVLLNLKSTVILVVVAAVVVDNSDVVSLVSPQMDP